LDPQLGRDEQILAGDAAGGDRPPDGFLVLVSGGGIEVTVTDGKRLGDRSLGVSGGI